MQGHDRGLELTVPSQLHFSLHAYYVLSLKRVMTLAVQGLNGS